MHLSWGQRGDPRPVPSRWRRAALFFEGERASVLAIVGMTLLLSGINALEPLVLKYVFDGIGRPRGGRALVAGVALLAVIGLAREAVGAAVNWRTWRTRLAVHHRLLDSVVGRLHRLPISFYRNEGVGAIMTRLDRGTSGVVDAASQLAFQLLPAVIFLGVAVVVMVSLDWRLALLVLAFAPLPPILAARAAPAQTARERSLLERWMQIYSRFNEVLSGILTVRSFAREEEEKRRFIRDVADANQLVLGGVRDDTEIAAQQNLVVAVARVAALALGGYLALRGEISVGTLVAFLSYVGSVFAPVQGLSGLYRTWRKAAVSLDTVFSILDEQDSLGDAPGAPDLENIRGEVAFEGISFRYGPDRPVLAGVDLRAAPGELVALVGPSGSGKSTLMALLQRFYDPSDGRVTIDGVDLRSVRQASLRRHIGTVLQEPLLFDDTVAANIAYGRPDASSQEIAEAARAANAHPFILRLPEGYDTRLGERGSRLSSGERQRIAIARALVKNPAILVLDEATSALDAESEELVQEALDRLVRGRTTFVIAHRLATVVRADRICVLREGRLEETGKHEELLAAGGYYASLVRRQTDRLLAPSYWTGANRRRRRRRRQDSEYAAPFLPLD